MSNDHLDFQVDQLENRLLLAGDVSVSIRGENVSIVGDNAANSVRVFVSEGTVHVSTYAELVDTGLAEIRNLRVNLKDSGDTEVLSLAAAGGIVGDTFEITNDVVVTNRTSINMGAGENYVNFGGLHNRARIRGGRDADHVVLNGGFATRVAAVSVGGGNDHVQIEVAGYVDAIEDGGPLVDYLNDVIEEVDVDDPSAALRLVPKIRGNLGGGDDLFEITLDGAAVTDDVILDGINLIGDELGFEFDSIEEAVDLVDTLADDLGIKLPNAVRLSGGGGTDTFLPGSAASILGLIGKVNRFEAFEAPENWQS